MTVLEAKIISRDLAEYYSEWKEVHERINHMHQEEFDKITLENGVLNVYDLANYFDIKSFKNNFDIVDRSILGDTAFKLFSRDKENSLNEKYVEKVKSSIEKLINQDFMLNYLKRNDEFECVDRYEVYKGNSHINLLSLRLNNQSEETGFGFYPSKFHTADLYFKTKRKNIHLNLRGINSTSDFVVLNNFVENKDVISTIGKDLFVLKDRSTEFKKAIFEAIKNSEPTNVSYFYVDIISAEVTRRNNKQKTFCNTTSNN